MPSLACHTRPYGSLHAEVAISNGVSLPSERPRRDSPGLRNHIPVRLRQIAHPISALSRACTELRPQSPEEKGDDQERHDKGASSALSCSATSISSDAMPPSDSPMAGAGRP